MTRAMSEDLRWRVVRLVVDEGLSTSEAGQRMWVGKSTVGNRPANPPYQGRRTCLTLSFAERKTRA